MAKMDHYENGKWVGSTEVPGHSNTTGWVNTYSADGKVRSTWVDNTDQFDYKESQHGENSTGGSEVFDEILGKIHGPLLIFGLVGFGLVVAILLGMAVSEVGLVGVLSLLKEIVVSAFSYPETYMFIISLLISLVPFAISKSSKKKNKKSKKNEKNIVKY